jgi:hypothetical protein
MASLGLDEGGELPADLALVISGFLFASDRFEGCRQLGILQERSDLGWCPVVGQIESTAGLVEVSTLSFEVEREAGGYGKAVPREADGGLQQVVERFRAEPVMRVHPPRDGAGNAHRQGTRLGNLVRPGRGEELRRGESSRPATRVERADLARLTVVEDGERVSADTVHVRSRHGEHPGHRDDRVGRVPAVPEHRQPGLGGEGVAGRDGPDRSSHVGSVLRRIDRGDERPGRGRLLGGLIAAHTAPEGREEEEPEGEMRAAMGMRRAGRRTRHGVAGGGEQAWPVQGRGSRYVAGHGLDAPEAPVSVKDTDWGRGARRLF